MIRRLLAAVVAVVVLATASAVPANAAPPPLTTGWRFWSPEICMAIGDTSLNAAYIAQRWNVQSQYVLKISARNNCVTAGYPASRRFTITSYYADDSQCYKVTDVNGADLYPGSDGTEHNGWIRYTNNPIVWINKQTCGGVLNAYLAHKTSAGIGGVLALAMLNSSGYNSRVMNFTAWSQLNVPYPDPYSGALLRDIYSGVHG